MIGLIDGVVHQKQISNTEEIQYLKTSLMGQVISAISEIGFSTHSYYHNSYVLDGNYGGTVVKVNAEFRKNILNLQFGKKFYDHPQTC